MRIKSVLTKIMVVTKIMSVIFMFGSVVYAADDVYISFQRDSEIINVNLTQINTEPAYLSEDGATYVPLHTFAEAFDVDVQWNGELRQVSLAYQDTSALLQINEKAAMVNKSLVALDYAPVLNESVTMIPVRVFGDIIDANVETIGDRIIVSKGKKPTLYSMSNRFIFPPSNTGRTHTYTVWDEQTWVGDSRNVINYLDSAVSSNYWGFVTYGQYYSVAMSPKFGCVGDMVMVIQDNNTMYPVIIADEKRQNCIAENSNEWGHLGGQDLVEFEILKRGEAPIYNGSGWYAGEQFDHYIVQAVNLGSVYDKPEYINDVSQAIIDNMLYDYNLITI